MDQPLDESDVLPANLSVNLETRRRRKDGHARLNIRRSSIFPADSDDQIQPLRTSAKRKLGVREAEDSGVMAVKDDFVFSRRTSTLPDPKGNDSSDEVGRTTGGNEGNTSTSLERNVAPAERKVLGKSTWTSHHNLLF